MSNRTSRRRERSDSNLRKRSLTNPKRSVSQKPLKKPLTLWQNTRRYAKKHGLPCIIEVEWPKGDSRNRYKKKLMEMGALSHDEHSEHRCRKCFDERIANSPYQDIEVEGLNELTLARIRRQQHQFAQANEPTPLKPQKIPGMR